MADNLFNFPGCAPQPKAKLPAQPTLSETYIRQQWHALLDLVGEAVAVGDELEDAARAECLSQQEEALRELLPRPGDKPDTPSLRARVPARPTVHPAPFLEDSQYRTSEAIFELQKRTFDAMDSLLSGDHEPGPAADLASDALWMIRELRQAIDSYLFAATDAVDVATLASMRETLRLLFDAQRLIICYF